MSLLQLNSYIIEFLQVSCFSPGPEIKIQQPSRKTDIESSGEDQARGCLTDLEGHRHDPHRSWVAEHEEMAAGLRVIAPSIQGGLVPLLLLHPLITTHATHAARYNWTPSVPSKVSPISWVGWSCLLFWCVTGRTALELVLGLNSGLVMSPGLMTFQNPSVTINQLVPCHISDIS